MTASEKILQKALAGSRLSSAEWSSVQAGLRDRAFFSARVESVRFLHDAREMAAKRAGGGLSDSEMRRELRRTLDAENYAAPDGKAGTIQDLRSKARLDLIARTNVQQARGYVQFKDGMSEGALRAFPAQELIRVRQRRVERDWRSRWLKAGGRLYGGRMIALKTDPIWTNSALNRFGTPYPPFDFNSGMGVRDIGRRECLRLGVISENDPPQKPLDKGFNDSLAVNSPKEIKSINALEDIFGDQIIKEGKEIKWRANLIKDKFTSGEKFKINLGKPTAELLSKLPQGEEKKLKQKNFTVNGEWLDNKRKDGSDHRDHFYPLEKRPENIPLTVGDLDLIPTLWRNPDRVLKGGYDGSVVCQLDTFDGGILSMVVDFVKMPKIKTMYKSKSGVGISGPDIPHSSPSQGTP